MKKHLLKKLITLILVVFVAINSLPYHVIAEEADEPGIDGKIVSEVFGPEEGTSGEDIVPAGNVGEENNDPEPADIPDVTDPKDKNADDNETAEGGKAAPTGGTNPAEDKNGSGKDESPSGKKADSENEPEEQKKPAEEDVQDIGMLRSPATRGTVPETVAGSWVIPGSTGVYYWPSVPARDLTEVSDTEYFVCYKLETERTDLYCVSGLGISNVYMNREYYSGEEGTVKILDSSGNVIFSAEITKRVSYTAPDYVLLERGKVYYFTAQFRGDHTAYKNWLYGEGGWTTDSTHYKGTSGLSPGFGMRHKYRDGKCVYCFSDYPDDQYSHMHYYLVNGSSGMPDYLYVATENDKDTRIVAKAVVADSSGNSFVTTTDHLTGLFESYYYYEQFDDYPMHFGCADISQYWDVTVWKDGGRYYPVTFRVSIDPNDFTLKTEIISGDGDVKLGYLPSGYDGLYFSNYIDLSRENSLFRFNEETDELTVGFTGYDDDGTYYNGPYSYNSEGVNDYLYKPLSFEHYRFEYDETEGLTGYRVLRRILDPNGDGYVYAETENHYIPYTLSIILKEKDPVPAPVVEEFDLELTDITDTTATITVSGRLDRFLLDAKADEAPYYTDIEEQIMLSVGMQKAVIGADEVSEDGSFTITLEDAPLINSVLLTTREDVYKTVYEEIGVPLLRMPVTKIWTDSDGNTGDDITARHSGDTVTVEVFADGEKTGRSIKLTADSETPWEGVILGLPEYVHYEKGSEPEKITYTAKEVEIKGYRASYGNEESSKYLEPGERVEAEEFSGKYIMLSEAGRIALSVEDGEVVAKPYDTDDEYQKWSTVPYTYAKAYLGIYFDEESTYMEPVFGEYDVLFVKNDKTGKYLAIDPSGAKLIDEETAHDSAEAAIYVVSPTTGNAIIRSVGYYENGSKIDINALTIPFYYNGYNTGSTGQWPVKWPAMWYTYEEESTDDPLSFTLVAPWASMPLRWNQNYEYWYDEQGNYQYLYRYFFDTIRTPWKFLALRWYDGSLKQIYSVTSTSSVLVNVTVCGEQNGLLYKVVNTPNTITVEKELEFETGNKKTVYDETFYIALFSDEARTKRVADIPVKELVIKDSSSGRIMLEGVPSGTYYIGETDKDGNLISEGTLSDGSGYEPEYGNYSVTISADDEGGATYSFKNVILEDPNTADIIVTKKLVDRETGADVQVKGKYSVYVALFKDAEHTMRVSGIERIDISGTSSGTAVFKDVEEGTYYVGETDANGNRLVAAVLSPEVGFVAEYTEGDKVEINGDTEKAEVTFTNQFETPPEDPPEEPEEPPKTDDLSVSWFNTWVVSGLLLLGALINYILSLFRKRNEIK